MVCHAVSTGALFMIAGGLQERTHTREISRLGGLWTTVPYLSGAALFFALASLGLPGLGDFVGEFLVLLGSSKINLTLTVLASVGVLAATLYALRMVQGAFHGPNINHWQLPDLQPREALVLGVMMTALLWLGLYPQPVIDTFKPATTQVQYVRR
jgi:NADH-quinone oxidoreductase subunit M